MPHVEANRKPTLPDVEKLKLRNAYRCPFAFRVSLFVWKWLEVGRFQGYFWT